MNVMDTARQLGRELFEANSIMARLAYAAARAVAAGEIGSDDAEQIYDTYFNAAMKRTNAGASHKAQVSKLRQVMKLAEERKDGVKLLERVMKMHANTMMTENVMPLYECMTYVARVQLQQSRALTNGDMIAIMRKV